MQVVSEKRGTMKYQRVRAELEKALREGRYRIGDRLPSERELSETFDVSLLTLRQALSILEGDGFISREPGRGTFVRSLSSSAQSGGPCSSNSIALIGIEDLEGGLIYEKEAVACYRAGFKAIDAHLARYNRHLVFAYTNTRELVLGRLPKALEQNAVSGVILDGFVEDYHVEYLRNREFPVVVLGNRPIQTPVSQVCFDVTRAGYLITKTLMDFNVGPVHFATEPFLIQTTHQLFRGYCQACHEADQQKHVYVFTHTGDDIVELRRMFERTSGSFGIFLNYNVAYAFADVYREHNLDLTDHPVAVFGSADHINMATRRDLNVCDTDIELASKVAVELMEEVLSGGKPRLVTLVPELTTSEKDGLIRMDMTWHRREETSEKHPDQRRA